MAENAKIDPSKIHLVQVNVTGANLNADSTITKENIKGFSTGFELSHGIAKEDKAIHFLFTVKLEAFDNGNDTLPVNAEYKLEFIFTIDNLEDFILTKDDEIYISPVLGGTLTGIVYSTTRGIVLSRTQGTILDGVILPVLDPLQLLLSAEKDNK